MTVQVQSLRICLYSGKTADLLTSEKLLNLAVWDGPETGYGITVEEFEASEVTIKGQEKMKKLDSSEITSIRLMDDRLVAYHWNGFRTDFDPKTLKVLAQTFTK